MSTQQRNKIREFLIARRAEQGKPPYTEYKLNRKIEKALNQFHNTVGRQRLDRWNDLEAVRADRRAARIILEEGSLRYGQDRTRTDPVGEVSVIRPTMARLTAVAGVNHVQHA